MSLGLASSWLVELWASTPVNDMSPGAQQSSRLALAHRLLDTMEYEQHFWRMYERELPTSAETAVQAGNREFRQKYLRPELIRPHLARGYAELFDEAELEQLIAFYSSPVGKKLKQVEPELVNAIQAVVTKIIQENQEEFRRLVLQVKPPGELPW